MTAIDEVIALLKEGRDLLRETEAENAALRTQLDEAVRENERLREALRQASSLAYQAARAAHVAAALYKEGQ